MQEKVYTKYDNECMIYLSLEILKALMLQDNHLYIDLYYKNIKEIYEDYKNYDNNNKSLLDSIHDYIDNNEQKILNIIKESVEL